jgi:hypothetical protein
VTLRASLGDAKSSLRDATSSLGDTKSSLGDAERSPPPPPTRASCTHEGVRELHSEKHQRGDEYASYF